jgi:hypothetical protein
VEAKAQAVLRWLALKENHQWLMIIDNVDREHSLDVESNTSHHQHSRCTWPRTLYDDIETNWRGRIYVQHMVCIFDFSGLGVRFDRFD